MVEAEIDVAKLNEEVREESLQLQAAMDEVRKVIVGQKGLIDRMMVALLWACPAWPRLWPSRPSARSWTSSSHESSSPPTCCRPTSWAR